MADDHDLGGHGHPAPPGPRSGHDHDPRRHPRRHPRRDRHLARIPRRDSPRARRFLLLDAWLTGANGLLYAAGGDWIAGWSGAPAVLVHGLGAFLLLVAAAVAVLATRRPVPRRWLVALAGFNGVWVVASLDYAVVGGLDAPGVAWTVVQAAVVAAFAAEQLRLARRG